MVARLERDAGRLEPEGLRLGEEGVRVVVIVTVSLPEIEVVVVIEVVGREPLVLEPVDPLDPLVLDPDVRDPGTGRLVSYIWNWAAQAPKEPTLKEIVRLPMLREKTTSLELATVKAGISHCSANSSNKNGAVLPKVVLALEGSGQVIKMGRLKSW